MVSGSRPARVSTIVVGWWNRGTTSIQPVLPKILAEPGDWLRIEIVSAPVRPSS
jgi:hypothetical protein